MTNNHHVEMRHGKKKIDNQKFLPGVSSMEEQPKKYNIWGDMKMILRRSVQVENWWNYPRKQKCLRICSNCEKINFEEKAERVSMTRATAYSHCKNVMTK